MNDTAIPPRPGEPPTALTRAITRLMRPLVKVLISNGMTFPVFSKLLKEVYVDVAARQFPIPGKPQTDSRINLLTGVHRKDIRTFRESEAKGLPPSPKVSRNARMIAIWTGAPDYLDDRGRPKPLARHKSDNAKSSFETLVESISKDIRARAVLDEWLRQKLVTVDDNDQVHLNSAAFVPSEDFEDLAFYFGRNLRDHIASAGHNMSGAEPAMLERAVYYEGLTAGSVATLNAMARETGSNALIALNKKAYALAEIDKSDPDATHRISFGVYFYNRDESSDAKSGDDNIAGEGKK